MATAADIIMAPGAPRPETAGVRKDAPAAEPGATSFAEVLDTEVQNPTDAEAESSAAPAAATTTPQEQPAPTTASVVELLISLQSSDIPVAQPDVPIAEGALATPSTPAAAVAPAITAETFVAPPASPTSALPAPASVLPVTATLEQTAQLPLPQAQGESSPVQLAAAATVAAPIAASATPKAVQPDVTDSQDEPASGGDADDAALSSPTAAETVAAEVDPAAVAAVTPAETPTRPAAPTTAVAQAMTVIVGAAVPAPKPSAPATSQPAAETSTETQIAASREADALVPEALARPSKSAATDPGAASPSQATASAAKPQAGVQTTAVDAAPDIRTDAPAQTSSSTSTSFADLLAATRGATAEAGKPAQTHPALQTAPQAAVQVYTRFVERFDGRAQRFEVRLDPAELGRVDVRIEVGADKRVHAVLAVHDSAALTDLMRGQRALERALADAGIDLSDGGIQFELADDSGRSLAGGEQRRDAWSGEDVHVWRGFSTADVAVEAGVAELAIATNAYSRRATRLDLVA